METKKENINYPTINEKLQQPYSSMMGHIPAIPMPSPINHYSPMMPNMPDCMPGGPMPPGHIPAMSMPSMPIASPMPCYPPMMPDMPKDYHHYEHMKKMYYMHMHMAYMHKAEAYKHKMLYYEHEEDYNNHHEPINCQCKADDPNL